MELPYQVETLDDVPESARSLYQETDGGYRLPVKGVKAESDIAGLESALRKLKEERSELKTKAQLAEQERKELEELRNLRKQQEQKKLESEGRWDDLREQLQNEHKAVLTKREQVIERLTVTSEMQAAIAAAGFDPKYHDAVEALLSRKGPRVEWDGEMPKGVFPDEVHGNKAIREYIAEWAKTPEAERFLPPSTGPGGGGTGSPSKTGSLSGKKYADMTFEERTAYLEAKYANVG